MPSAATALPATGQRRDRDIRLLTGWGRTSPTLAAVASPRDVAELERALGEAGARGAVARGLGRCYGDAAQNAGGVVISTTGIGGVELDLEADLATVGAGVSVAALTRRLLPHGRFLPVVPGTAHVTVGGAIASDIHGKNHHRDGGFAAQVAGFELLTARGERLPVTRESAPDVFASTAGGMGLTGVITRATLRLLRVETGSMVVDTERATDLDDAMARMQSGDERYRYSVAWIDCLARGRRLGRSVLIRGDHARLEQLDRGDRSAPLASPRTGAVKAPPWAPGGLLRPSTVRAFNELWFRRAPREERGRIESVRRFFHPLDSLRDWNRLYGRSGLVQYQLVVPFGREAAVRAILERLTAARSPSFLAVIKRLGPQAGPLAFAVPGWTLAVDLPAGRHSLAALLDGLDEVVADAGGRVYLAKDSRLRPELLPTMYPRLEEWRALRARLDPDRRLRSDMSRRLGLDP